MRGHHRAAVRGSVLVLAIAACGDGSGPGDDIGGVPRASARIEVGQDRPLSTNGPNATAHVRVFLYDARSQAPIPGVDIALSAPTGTLTTALDRTDLAGVVTSDWSFTPRVAGTHTLLACVWETDLCGTTSVTLQP